MHNDASKSVKCKENRIFRYIFEISFYFYIFDFNGTLKKYILHSRYTTIIHIHFQYILNYTRNIFKYFVQKYTFTFIQLYYIF